MESEGPDNHSGEDEADDEATILRFPRNWFGPTEELVPFGPRAAAPDRSAPQPPPAPGDEPGPAETFWTEGSAAVHDPVQAGETIEPGPEVAPSSRGRRRHVMMACGAAALVVVAGMAAFSGGGGRPARSGRASAAVHIRVWTAVSHTSLPKRPARIARRHGPASESAPATKPVVTQTASAQSPPPSSGTGSPPTQATSSSGSSEAAQSGGSSQPSASAASAQSTSQPAFGANGALGPGHSPNS